MNGAKLDLAPGIQRRVIAHVKVLSGATVIDAENITRPVG